MWSSQHYSNVKTTKIYFQQTRGEATKAQRGAAAPHLARKHAHKQWSTPMNPSKNLQLREEFLLLSNEGCARAHFFFLLKIPRPKKGRMESSILQLLEIDFWSGSNEEKEIGRRETLSPIPPHAPFQNSPNLFFFFFPINLHQLACQ